MVNIRSKGQRGEREVIDIFVGSMQIVEKELRSLGYDCPQYSEKIQRNSLQSDKGGHDVAGLPFISVEIKRQEALAINTWWEQCLRQAQDTNLIPVLIYRQSRVAWKVISFVKVSNGQPELDVWVRAEYSMGDFMKWYAGLYKALLLQNSKLTEVPVKKIIRRK